MEPNQIRRAWAICKKDIRIYYSAHPVIVHGILFPFFLFFAFFIRRNLSMEFILPGLVGMTLFFTSTAIVSIIPSWETRSKTLERLVSSPVLISTIVIGDIFAAFLFGVVVSLVPISIGILGGISIHHPLIAALGILISALCFSCLGALLSASPTDIPANVMTISTLIKFPLIFVSGVFIPLKDLPLWGKILASFSPLTYFVDLLRFSIKIDYYYSVGFDFLALFIFALIFYILAVRLHVRAMPNRI
ncbi:MAG: ABC transporter permease [Candidatus Latescibacteria bacterium]|nr:ABC transporter permease [Candidatus Latescibacterota bacterium]